MSPFARAGAGRPARRSLGGGGRSGLREAIRTATPIRDFRLVDLVAHVIGRGETGSGADRAVNVDQTAADSADQMVMVVADPILEASRRPGGLNTPDQAFGDQEAEGVIDRLEGDGPDFGPDDLGHAVGRDVRLTRDSPQNSQSLSRDLNAVLAKEVCWVGGHARKNRSIFRFSQSLD